MNTNSILRKAIASTILPCPCCGGTDVYFKIITEKTQQDVTDKTDLSSIDKTDWLREKVGCFTCGLNMTRATSCDIISQWNKRVPLK